jgi:hypothetical protein
MSGATVAETIAILRALACLGPMPHGSMTRSGGVSRSVCKGPKGGVARMTHRLRPLKIAHARLRLQGRPPSRGEFNLRAATAPAFVVDPGSRPGIAAAVAPDAPINGRAMTGRLVGEHGTDCKAQESAGGGGPASPRCGPASPRLRRRQRTA